MQPHIPLMSALLLFCGALHGADTSVSKGIIGSWELANCQAGIQTPQPYCLKAPVLTFSQTGAFESVAEVEERGARVLTKATGTYELLGEELTIRYAETAERGGCEMKWQVKMQDPFLLLRESSGFQVGLTMALRRVQKQEIWHQRSQSPRRPVSAAKALGEVAGALKCALQCEPTCILARGLRHRAPRGLPPPHLHYLYPVGRVPKVTVAITNGSKGDISLVGSLNGSDLRWRYPLCYFEVTGPDGKPADREVEWGFPTRKLREADFVRVAPGGVFDPYQHADRDGSSLAQQLRPWFFATPGEYRIRFVYSTSSNSVDEWYCDAEAPAAARNRLLDMLRRVPKVKVRSNEVKVTVLRSPGRTPDWRPLFLDGPLDLIPRN